MNTSHSQDRRARSNGALTRKQLGKSPQNGDKLVFEEDSDCPRKKSDRIRNSRSKVSLKRSSSGKLKSNQTQINHISEEVEASVCKHKGGQFSPVNSGTSKTGAATMLRERKTSCDELKGVLMKQNSESSQLKGVLMKQNSESSPLNSSPERLDNEHVDNSDESSIMSFYKKVKNRPAYNFRRSTTVLLTDFERFVMENKNKEFKDTCFPAQIGEECDICVSSPKLGSELSKVDIVSSAASGGKLSLQKVGNRLYSVSSFSSVGSERGSNSKQIVSQGRSRPMRQLSSLSDGSDSQELSLNSESSGSGESLSGGLGLRSFGNRLCSVSSFSSIDSQFYEILKNKTLRDTRSRRRLSSLSDDLDSQDPGSKQKIVKTSSENTSMGGSVLVLDSMDRNNNGFYSESPETGISDADVGHDDSSTIEAASTSEYQFGSDKDRGNNDEHSELSAVSCERIPDWMYVAVDCEMVGTGPRGSSSALGRCSIVDYQGNVVYDKYVKPSVPVTDYRTRYSGIRPSHLVGALPMSDALGEIHEILANKIIVGHSVYNDFRVLKMKPPFYTVRDTAQCNMLVRLAGLEGQGNGLKKLAAALLDRNIQTGRSGHCSVEDARATLDLFKLVRGDYEAELYKKWANKSSKKVMSSLAGFIENAHKSRGLRVRVDSTGDGQFLEDEYWPAEGTETGGMSTS